MEDIAKTYMMGTVEVQAIKGISFLMDHGEYAAIMGPSGSGKSTFMNLLGCLDTPSSGSYILEGQLVSELNDDDLARIRNRKIGFIFQTFNLLSTETAVRNVELPMLYAGIPPEKRFILAQSSLEQVGLGKRLFHKPNELSGGERQRVAIARSIANDPSILLADEPTGNLDSKTGSEIMDIFEKLHETGKTIIIVTHDEKIAGHAKRLIKIMDGTIIADEKV